MYYFLYIGSHFKMYWYFVFNICYYMLFHVLNLIYFFSIQLLSVLRDHSVFSSPPQRPMTSDFEGFLSQILSITFFSLSLFFRKSQYYVECQTRELLVPLLYRLWYDAVLDWGLNPGPTALESQHSNTRLSRRRFKSD